MRLTAPTPMTKSKRSSSPELDELTAPVLTFPTGAATFDYASNTNREHNAGSPVGPSGEVGWRHGAIRDAAGRVTLRIYDCLKPVIAAVNGPAVGAGATMLLAMDIRIASHAARFGFVFSRRGIVPEACSSWFLPRIVGISRALEWAFSGRLFSAAEALENGLAGY
jgi:enoyl-CoA hydratase/carnithine racemase